MTADRVASQGPCSHFEYGGPLPDATAAPAPPRRVRRGLPTLSALVTAGFLSLACVDTASAQEALADTTVADPAATDTTVADTSASTPRQTGVDLPKVIPALGTFAPRDALLRSALLPGWGQLCNGKPVKAVFFAGVSGGFLTAAVLDAASAGDIDDPERREDRVARRNTRFLFFFIATTLSALDAYVDAHLADFGPEPVTSGSGLPGLQLMWTRTF